MKTIGTRTLVRVPLGLALLLAIPTPAPAQMFYGLAGGLTYSGPAPSGQSYTHGFSAQASVGRQLNQRVGVRLDALLSHFADQAPPSYPPCTSTGVCAVLSSPDRPVGVGGLAASGLVDVTPAGSEVMLYLIAGGGGYYLYPHPSAEGAVRFGVSAGAGLAVRVRGRSQLFVEARYHDLLNAPSQPMWLAPVTAGIRF